jgi:regulator of replication initiation timing
MIQMSRYTKAQLEEFFYQQYAYIEGLSEQIRLLQEQNTIYNSLNKKLEEQLNKPKQLYKKSKVKKSGM